ncbi:MAG: hypothetical protein WAL59_33020 [Roseiarcus sp.]
MSLLASVARALLAAVTSELTLQAEANKSEHKCRWRSGGADIEHVAFLYGSAREKSRKADWLAPLSELL